MRDFHTWLESKGAAVMPYLKGTKAGGVAHMPYRKKGEKNPIIKKLGSVVMGDIGYF